jgi:hemicentin
VVQAVAGRPMALQCVARGRPPPTLSWHHEGLTVAESNGTWLEAGGSLRLESPGEASRGLYGCVASSPAGEAVLWYSVDVQGEPGQICPLPPDPQCACPKHPWSGWGCKESTGTSVLYAAGEDIDLGWGPQGRRPGV